MDPTSLTSRKFVIADPGRCIGCKTCMAACLHRHDVPGDVPVPRLQLVCTLKISAPVGCHHCVDAPCVEACPTGCLYSDDEHVGVHPDKCIGCRNCVLACPYGAVDIVTEKLPPEEEPPPEQPRRPGKRARKRRAKSTVVKCDLCFDRIGGSACVGACPTGALKVIDQQMLERRVQKRRREAALAAEAYSSFDLNDGLEGEAPARASEPAPASAPAPGPAALAPAAASATPAAEPAAPACVTRLHEGV